MRLPARITVLVALTASAVAGAGAARAVDSGCRNAPTGGYVLQYPYLSEEDGERMRELAAVDRKLGDVPRSYMLYVPDGIDARSAPLLVTMHGLGGSGGQHAEKIEMESTADRHGFVIASPTGARTWDNSDRGLDIGFIRDVVADVRATHCIDGRRIYASGHSNGAFMTHRLACDAADLFAAGASMAAGDVENGLQGGPCQPDGRTVPPGEEPMPLALWHGDSDSVIRYQSGRLGLTKWLARYGCDPVPRSETEDAYGTLEVYGSCTRPDVVAREAAARAIDPGAAPFEITFRTLTDHDHGWANGCGGTPTCDPANPERPFPTADELNEAMWAFLAAHPRSTAAA